MADVDEYADESLKMKSAHLPRKRRRVRFYLPGGYAVHRLIMISVGLIMMSAGGAALFGAILGDIWLWRLLYG